MVIRFFFSISFIFLTDLCIEDHQFFWVKFVFCESWNLPHSFAYHEHPAHCWLYCCTLLFLLWLGISSIQAAGAPGRLKSVKGCTVILKSSRTCIASSFCFSYTWHDVFMPLDPKHRFSYAWKRGNKRLQRIEQPLLSECNFGGEHCLQQLRLVAMIQIRHLKSWLPNWISYWNLCLVSHCTFLAFSMHLFDHFLLLESSWRWEAQLWGILYGKLSWHWQTPHACWQSWCCWQQFLAQAVRKMFERCLTLA